MQDYIFKQNYALGNQNGGLWGHGRQSETAGKARTGHLRAGGERVADKTNGILKTSKAGKNEIHIYFVQIQSDMSVSYYLNFVASICFLLQNLSWMLFCSLF